MKKLYQVGPKKTLNGGIATIINNINKSKDINNKYDIVNIETIDEKGKLVFIKSLVLSLFIKKDSIIHFHVASKGSFFRKYIIFKISSKECKKVVHLHGGGFLNFYDNSNNIVKRMIKNMLLNSDSIINVSDNMQNALIIKFPEIKYKCIRIYNSIDYSETGFTFDKKENLIVFMGKLIDYKGIYDLLDIIFAMKDNIRKRRWSFKIAGNGEVEKVKNFISDNNLNDIVDVLGWIEGEEKIKLLEKSKIFIMPSRVESFGIAAVEAMNYGNVIVCSDVGGLPEIVKSENGYVVKNNSIEEYCKVLNHLIENNDEMREISQRNIKKSEEFSLEKMFSNLIKEYENL
ncbi:TPA: glycosyltransferase family 4 protein [Clostridium perfringens]|nr:glycosyltransferase family 4 protein [Clostridium perfringens]